MKGQPPFYPTKRILVCERPARSRAYEIVATYGENVEKSALKLARHGFQNCPRRVHDLCLIVAGVSHADRAVRRRRSLWPRGLIVAIPVYEVDFWSQAHVLAALIRVLSVLTGDYWSFEFYHRKDEPPAVAQSELPIWREDLRVLPYSHGLDSFALRALELEASSRRSLMLMTSGGKPPGWSEFQARYGAHRVEHLTLPLHTTLRSRQSRDREPSNRSRAFVFGVAAGVTAYFCGSSTILCAEAGQGSFGPWLDPVGRETPDIRTHPLFSRLLEEFIKAVLDHQVRFDHPRLWSTKGETLKALVDLGIHEGWETTLSCAHRRNFTRLERKRVNCGACCACLLRRASLRAAGLDHDSSRYLWADLSAPSLGQSAAPCARAPVEDDELQAWAAVAAMERFAARASENLAATRPAHMFEVARACSLAPDEVANRLAQVTAKHQEEWDGFCDALSKGSFINAFRNRLQVRRP
jgi:hypothetical protein